MITTEELGNYKHKINYVLNNNVIGYVVLEETVDVINIVDVFVLEDYRRQKVATKLFQYILDKYRSKKEKIMLEVRENNLPAINLYKKIGFNVIHIRRKYYKDEDALIMEVKL